MKTLTLILCFWINSIYASNICVKALVDKAYDPNFKADYFLFIPVETSKYKKARLMITKENFRKYMIALDSSYSNNNKLKGYLEELLNKKQIFFFHEFFYVKKFGAEEYKLLSQKNAIDIGNPSKQIAFLKKYILNFTKTRNDFELDLSIPIMNDYFVYENLFKLNYLVANSDGFVAVYKVNCKNQ